jgi:hypothetical protein
MDIAYPTRTQRSVPFQDGRQPILVDLIRGRDSFVKRHNKRENDASCAVNQGVTR